MVDLSRPVIQSEGNVIHQVVIRRSKVALYGAHKQCLTTVLKRISPIAPKDETNGGGYQDVEKGGHVMCGLSFEEYDSPRHKASDVIYPKFP